METFTRHYKGLRGYRSETEIKLGGNRVLSITTMKRNGGNLATCASVGLKEGSFITHTMYQDYSATLINEFKRVTKNAVIQQHQAGLNLLSMVLDDVYKQYGVNNG
tara:strand:- start:1315 stop:1632 length:318 start_codon:yes stop_codon:yes gene_type:complete